MALHWVVSGVQGLKGLVLSAPYLALALDPPKMKIFSAKVAGLVIPWLPVPTGIEYAQLSRDEAWQKATQADPLYGHAPRRAGSCVDPGAAAQGGRPRLRAAVGVHRRLRPHRRDGRREGFFETVGSNDKRARSMRACGTRS